VKKGKRVKKIFTNQLQPLTWSAPKRTFAGEGIQVSEALEWHYPDSGKWGIQSPGGRRSLRSEPLDYYDGEE
jgi:hypothetical protein